MEYKQFSKEERQISEKFLLRSDFLNMQQAFGIVREEHGMPFRWFLKGLRYLSTESKKKRNQIDKFVEDVEKRFNTTDILYFPTYRRIEEDFNRLIKSDDEIQDVFNFQDRIIQHHMKKHQELLEFGMEDVDAILSSVLKSIRVKSIESFNELNGVLLTQYLGGNINKKIDFEEDELSISLYRLGDKISNNQKERIMDELFKKLNHENTGKIYLINYVVNLVENYRKTQPIDKKLKRLFL